MVISVRHFPERARKIGVFHFFLGTGGNPNFLRITGLTGGEPTDETDDDLERGSSLG
jgi:hypothetical protein